MAIPKRTIRTSQNIRSNSGKVDLLSEPYRAFMRISALEMEKARRGKERESAMFRVKEIDARFREIEKEKAYLLNGVGGLKTIKTHTPGNRTPQPAGLNTARGFKLRY
jgi:hypothetical protein